MNNKFSFKNLINGLCLGASNIIPGVSGGTVAVILGIYEKLLESIGGLRKDFKSNFGFLAQIGIGAIVGIVAFSGVISFLLEKYTLGINYLFIGFVLGGVGMIIDKIEKKKMSLSKVIGFIIGVFMVLGISLIGSSIQEKTVVIDAANQGVSYLSLMFAGFMTAFTMILPGISGSLTLVMLGLYDDFVTAIATFNIPYLMAGAIGGIIGLFVTVKLISYLLKHYNDITYSAILGLVIGSSGVIAITNPIGSSWLVALAGVFTGALLTITISKMSS